MISKGLTDMLIGLTKPKDSHKFRQQLQQQIQKLRSSDIKAKDQMQLDVQSVKRRIEYYQQALKSDELNLQYRKIVALLLELLCTKTKLPNPQWQSFFCLLKQQYQQILAREPFNLQTVTNYIFIYSLCEQQELEKCEQILKLIKKRIQYNDSFLFLFQKLINSIFGQKKMFKYEKSNIKILQNPELNLISLQCLEKLNQMQVYLIFKLNYFTSIMIRIYEYGKDYQQIVGLIMKTIKSYLLESNSDQFVTYFAALRDVTSHIFQLQKLKGLRHSFGRDFSLFINSAIKFQIFESQKWRQVQQIIIQIQIIIPLPIHYQIKQIQLFSLENLQKEIKFLNRSLQYFLPQHKQVRSNILYLIQRLKNFKSFKNFQLQHQIHQIKYAIVLNCLCRQMKVTYEHNYLKNLIEKANSNDYLIKNQQNILFQIIEKLIDNKIAKERVVQIILQCGIDIRLSALIKFRYLDDRSGQAIIVKPLLIKIILLKQFWFDNHAKNNYGLTLDQPFASIENQQDLHSIKNQMHHLESDIDQHPFKTLNSFLQQTIGRTISKYTVQEWPSNRWRQYVQKQVADASPYQPRDMEKLKDSVKQIYFKLYCLKTFRNHLQVEKSLKEKVYEFNYDPHSLIENFIKEYQIKQ